MLRKRPESAIQDGKGDRREDGLGRMLLDGLTVHMNPVVI